MDQKLGEAVVVLQTFPQLQQALDGLATPTFLRATPRQKEEQIHRLLLTLIQKEQVPCFLLGAVNAFILAIREKNWLESYVFSHFEFWLNRASGLSQEENYFIRAKIAGKYLPREAYQVLFPIGMGKFYSGSHYVTAHGSPDLDTTVASFWGWLDAFSARVSEGLHLWNIPGGAPESQVEVQFLFPGMLGKDCFTHFAKNRTALSLSAMDLVTQEDVVRKTGNELVFGGEGGKKGAMLLVDDEGYYLGDWRPLDEEEVRKVAILLHNCLRFFASVFHKKLTYLFSQDVLLSQELQEAIQGLFALTFAEIELVKEYAESQRVLLSNYLTKVLSIQGGLQSSFHDFWQAMDRIPLPHFAFFKEQVESFASSSLFDSAEKLVETRSVIFDALERSVTALENAIQSFKRHGEQLQVAFTIKKQLLVTERESISYRAELEEIRSRMDDLPYLTVTMPDAHRGEEAVGIVKASVLTKPFLGTVSLRDFCNRDETKIPSYFEVISVIDHHKSALATGAAPVAFIGDAQSANALVAEVAFSLYDSYAAPCSLKSIAEQYAELQESKTPGRLRLLQRLLQKQAIIESQQPYFVDSKREYMEYLQYLYAILDDTDLLSKVSYRDVICVVSLLNRMKSLLSGKEQEVLQLDDLPRDNMFAVNAAKRILQNEEMYSLYRKIYLAKEEALVQSLRLCVKGEKTSLFADTKVQNGCNRVGQTKLFENTFPAYLERAGEIRAIWYFEAKHYQEEHKDCDLHMHMMSTVPSAESVYAGGEKAYEHKDELWLWIPAREQAVQHLKSFLSAFRAVPQVAAFAKEMEVLFFGENQEELKQIFQESFLSIPQVEVPKGKVPSIPIAVLRYKAGLLNSRKAMITPFLPKLMT